MAEVSLGTQVRGIDCPRCGEEDVLYNGNYFCAQCGWAMPEQSPGTRYIVVAYVKQEYDDAVRKKDTQTAERMRFYLNQPS